jgi:hypothetical protein
VCISVFVVCVLHRRIKLRVMLEAGAKTVDDDTTTETDGQSMNREKDAGDCEMSPWLRRVTHPTRHVNCACNA